MPSEDTTSARATEAPETKRVKSEPSATTEAPSGGLINSVRMIFGLFLAIVHSRLDLFATELEEERRRFLQALILGSALVLSVVGAFFCSLLFIIVLAWMFNVLLILLGVTTVVLAIVSIVMVLWLRALYSTRDKFFHYTLEELRKDIVGLRRAMGLKKENKG